MITLSVSEIQLRVILSAQGKSLGLEIFIVGIMKVASTKQLAFVGIPLLVSTVN
jgi:hypothetical protein